MRVDLLQTNLSGGELSPRLYGRVDLQKYNDAVKTAQDVILLQHGGATSRPATTYLGTVKTQTLATRLIPFVRSRTDAYVIEAGNGYFRFWKNGAVIGGVGTEYEIATPYSTANIFDVDFTQGADTMFIALQAAYPQRLQHFSDSRWVIGNAPFDPPPFDEIGRRQSTIITLGAVTGSTTATAATAAFLAADVGRTLQYNGGEATITSYTSATVVNITVTADFASVTLPAGSWTMTASPQCTCTPGAKEPIGLVTTLTASSAAWRSDDVGRYVSINGGLCKITSYTSDLIVNARIEAVLAATTGAESGSWTVESAVWNATDGYPATVTLHEQRLIAANTSAKPQTIWGSRSGLYLDFTKGIADDDSYSFDLVSDEVNPVQYLSSNRDLIALTYGGEWTLMGGIEKPITPTSVRAKPQAKAGSATVRPEQVDDDLYYVQRGATAVRTLGFDVTVGGYLSGEASTLSEHLCHDIDSLSYQQSPERVLWMLDADGSLSAVTVSREQNIRAVSKCTLVGGVVESIATIPEGDEDVTYIIVRRTVGGATKRYIERFTWNTYQDSRVTKTPAGAVVSGLGHMEGLSVTAVADGIYQGTFTVASGAITLPRTGFASCTVGIGYVPTVKLLAPEFGTGMGASSGRAVNVSEVRVLFQDTIGCQVNGKEVPFQTFDTPLLDVAPSEISGWKRLPEFGWSESAGEITLSQPRPYPWTILAVVRRMTANPG